MSAACGISCILKRISFFWGKKIVKGFCGSGHEVRTRKAGDFSIFHPLKDAEFFWADTAAVEQRENVWYSMFQAYFNCMPENPERDKKGTFMDLNERTRTDCALSDVGCDGAK